MSKEGSRTFEYRGFSIDLDYYKGFGWSYAIFMDDVERANSGMWYRTRKEAMEDCDIDIDNILAGEYDE